MKQPEMFSSEELRKAVKRFLVLLLSNSSAYPVENPFAILMGGQSGAGKTNLQDVLLTETNNNAIVINGDLYRRFHPRMNEIIELYGIENMPAYTALWAGQFVEVLIGMLSRLRYNLIIEGTLRTAEVPLKTAKLLTERGYDVVLAVLAVKPEISLASCEVRYKRMQSMGTYPRSVEPEVHNAIVRDLVQNLSVLETNSLFKNTKVYSRSGQLLYSASDNSSSSKLPSDVVEAVLFGDWTEEELQLHEYLLSQLSDKD